MIVLIAFFFFVGSVKVTATTSDGFGGRLTIGFVFLCIIVAIVGWARSGKRRVMVGAASRRAQSMVLANRIWQMNSLCQTLHSFTNPYTSIALLK